MLSGATRERARSLFAHFGNKGPIDDDVIMGAIEKLLTEADRHKADPASTLRVPLSAAFGKVA